MSVDLQTRYLGLTLRNPLVAASTPLTGDVEDLQRLEAAGAAAAVLPSLFQEQVEHEEMELHRLHEHGTESYAEALSYFPDFVEYNKGPEAYIRLIESAKKALSIPIIGSLNGMTAGGWVQYARWMQEAGADALELNIYFMAADPAQSGQDVETRYVDLVSAVRQAVTIPLAVKVGPFFSSMANMADRLTAAGADGLVLFNRFIQPDLDLDTLQVTPQLKLSTSAELSLPLNWIAILSGRIRASLAASTGAHGAPDVIKLLLVGADAVMMASALLREGCEHLTTVLRQTESWLEAREYISVEQMKGSVSQRYYPDPVVFERVNYMKALVNYASDFRPRP